MEPTFYADILFFAVVAGFIAFRLYTVLGKKDGTEQNITHRVKEMWEAKAAEVKQKAEAIVAEEQAAATKRLPQTTPAMAMNNVAEAAKEGVKILMEKDKNFTPERFLGGAQSAYEIILKGFAEGDKISLQRLLEPALLKEFETDMDRRKAAGEIMKTSIVAIVRAEITSAVLNGKTASVSVAFESEQVTCTKNAAGEVIAGNETTSERLHDTWVFERDITSRNPSWLLVDTDA